MVHLTSKRLTAAALLEPAVRLLRDTLAARLCSSAWTSIHHQCAYT